MKELNILHISNVELEQAVFIREELELLRTSENFRHEYLSIKVSNSKIKTYFNGVLLIRDALERTKFDIVHLHFGLMSIVYAFAIIGKKNKPKVCVTYYGSDLFNSSFQRSITLLFSSWLGSYSIAVSTGLRNYLRHNLKKMSKVIPNPVNPIFYDQAVEKYTRLKLIFTSDPLRKEKGFEFFLEVLSLLNRKGYITEVVFMKNLSRHAIKSILLEEQIILCLTSKYEGSPQIIKEALVSQTKCVCKNVGDVSSYVQFQTLKIANDPESFAEAVIDLHINKPSLDRTQLQDCFQPNGFVESLESVYREVLTYD